MLALSQFDRLKRRPSLFRLVTAQLAVWPEHAGYLVARFKQDDEALLAHAEKAAEFASTLIGDRMDEYCRDYAWMCANFLEEEALFPSSSQISP